MNPNFILENDFYKVNKCAHPAITMRNHTNLNWNNKLEYAIFFSLQPSRQYCSHIKQLAIYQRDWKDEEKEI